MQTGWYDLAQIAITPAGWYDWQDKNILEGSKPMTGLMPFLARVRESGIGVIGMKAGRYLAGDYGVTLTLSREFRSGMRVGAWTTFTDVSFEDFGEGSFDKGFFITIPFDALLLRSSRAQGLFSFRPLTRDGGQMVSVPDRLYFLTQEGSLRSVARYWSKFLD